jgi:hypothetical protein
MARIGKCQTFASDSADRYERAGKGLACHKKNLRIDADSIAPTLVALSVVNEM